MQDEGWVKIHRKIWSNPLMKNNNYLAVWIWLLTHAEYRDENEAGSVFWEGKKIKLRKGELSCGLFLIAEEIGTTKSTVERALNAFSNENQIEKRAGNKFTLVLVKNWEQYQDKRETNGKQTGNERETNGNIYKKIRSKEYKNIRNKKEDNTELIAAAAAAPAEIVSVFEVFKALAVPNYGNKTHRKAVEELTKSYGIEKVLAAAQYALSIQNEKYAPIITNPYQLKVKFGELVAYKARQDKNSKSLVAEI